MLGMIYQILKLVLMAITLKIEILYCPRKEASIAAGFSYYFLE
jgi:hypothetical protein